MVLHNYNSNAILVGSLKSRAESELLWSPIDLYKNTTDRGLHPHLHMLDNECSAGMNIFIRSAETQHQLLPPVLHSDLISKR